MREMTEVEMDQSSREHPPTQEPYHWSWSRDCP